MRRISHRLVVVGKLFPGKDALLNSRLRDYPCTEASQSMNVQGKNKFSRIGKLQFRP